MTTEINPAADHSYSASAGSANTLPSGSPGAVDTATPRPSSFGVLYIGGRPIGTVSNLQISILPEEDRPLPRVLDAIGHAILAACRFLVNCAAWVRVRVDAVVHAICAFFGPVEFDTFASCALCERVCDAVLPGAYPCTGPVHVADCTVCVRRVELTWAKRCPNGAKHLLTNVHPKT